MGLGSLSLIYALSSSFAIFPAYVMLSKTFTLEVKTGDLYRFLFSLQTFNWKLAFLSWNSLYAHIKHFIRSNAFFFKPLIENPNMFLHLQVPWWFSFSLFVKATREAFACFLDTHVSFQDFSFSKAPLFFFACWVFLFCDLNQDLIDFVHMYPTFLSFLTTWTFSNTFILIIF
jgi:hypothetical protein